MEPSCRMSREPSAGSPWVSVHVLANSSPKPQLLVFPRAHILPYLCGIILTGDILSQCSYALRRALDNMTIQKTVTAHLINYFHFSFALALIFTVSSVLLPGLV